MNRIQYLENQISSADETDIEKKIALWDELINTTRIAIDKINQDELLKFLGEKSNDSVSDEAKKYANLLKFSNKLQLVYFDTLKGV
jgi:hypothetical protein